MELDLGPGMETLSQRLTESEPNSPESEKSQRQKERQRERASGRPKIPEQKIGRQRQRDVETVKRESH